MLRRLASTVSRRSGQVFPPAQAAAGFRLGRAFSAAPSFDNLNSGGRPQEISSAHEPKFEWQTGRDNVVGKHTGKEAREALMSIAFRRDGQQPEFLQAVEEVVDDLAPIFERDVSYVPLMRFMLEPERVVKFRVPWIDDAGCIRVNRGYRVQFSSALGPYKGGLRFHPSVSESVIKFLGFEQMFKNSLTTLAMGAGKGGSDFDPKGKSEAEVMRFCQSFMTELSQYIGRLIDVPAGDIGVVGREIGYLYGQYKRITRLNEGVLTGKGADWGGSLIRPEATGYGCVFYAQEAMQHIKEEPLKGKRCVISGSGNVAQYTAEKLLQLGAIPISFSDSSGTIHEPQGFSAEQVDQLMQIKNVQRGRVSDYLQHSKTAQMMKDQTPWDIPCDLAFPSATQNELDGADAVTLAQNGCKGVFEGANMPCTPGAIACFQANEVIYGPGKAANAGGVAVSGLEMSQNAQLTSWTRVDVEAKLHNIMKSIFRNSADIAEEYGRPFDLKFGANAAGFLKVAKAVRDQGI